MNVRSGMSVWVETEITITHSKPELGFAFGKAMIDGEISSVYVSSRCHSVYDANGYWEISGEIVTPERGDEIFAKVNTKVSNGKKPYAAFWQFAILISWEIGLRLGDICSLEWDCFTTPGRVTVWTDKRDRRISVPLSDELQQLITLIPLTSDQYLFPTERVNIEQNKVAALSVFFKRLCEKVQITDKSFHCLRHGCITRWAKEGKSLESIGKDVGHANTKTTAGYVH